MAESLDFRPVLKEIEAKRLASEEKRERQLAIREDKDRKALNKIDQAKNANTEESIRGTKTSNTNLMQERAGYESR